MGRYVAGYCCVLMTSFTNILCIISTYVTPLALSFATTIKEEEEDR